MKELPDFRDPAFLRLQALDTLGFYDGRCVDPAGGFFHFFRSDGSVEDAHTRHLASSARFVALHALAARRFPTHERAPAWRDAIEHGLRFLQEAHRDPDSGGYVWLLRFERGRRTVLDETQRAAGVALVMLAQAQAVLAGVDSAAAGLEESFTLLEHRFWEPAHGLYASEASRQWALSDYRGQAANLHAVEALLAANEATGDRRFLGRAQGVADALLQRLPQPAPALLWEHHRADWSPDLRLERDVADPWRPWGIQVGHLAAWARLLLALERAQPELDEDNWMQHRARRLFAAAVEHGWDRGHGGLVSAFGPDFKVVHSERAAWVAQRAVGAAALLGERTSEGGYWDWYDRIWAHAWNHFVDPVHGGWHRQLGADNRPLDELKSPGGKTDLEAMQSCCDALDALERAPQPV